MKINSRYGRQLSLVEVIVALAILTLAFSGSMSLYYTSATYSRSSAERAEARAQGFAEIALLRSTLRSQPFFNGATDNRETQFNRVIGEAAIALANCAPNLAGNPQRFTGVSPTFTRTQQTTINRGKTTLTVVTTCYFSEAAAEADANLGITAGTLDLNADEVFSDATVIAPGDMWALPVTVSVTWATAEGNGATETVIVNGILY
jgi:Tfp pilus assembly protein PilW